MLAMSAGGGCVQALLFGEGSGQIRQAVNSAKWKAPELGLWFVC